MPTIRKIAKVWQNKPTTKASSTPGMSGLSRKESGPSGADNRAIFPIRYMVIGQFLTTWHASLGFTLWVRLLARMFTNSADVYLSYSQMCKVDTPRH